MIVSWKSGVLLQKLLLCQVRRVEGAGDSRGKAQVQNLVSRLRVRLEVLIEHILVDVVGLDIGPFRLNLIELLRENRLSVEVVRSIDGDRRRDHVDLIFVDKLPRQI